MPTLVLMRHADAANAPAGVADRDRPLTARGTADAAAVGREFARRGLAIDLVLVSRARRAIETFEAIREALPGQVGERPDPDLYGALPDGILASLRAHAGASRCVLVIGHNPGIGALAAMLARGQATPGLRGFGTATVAVFDIDAADWRAMADRARLRSVFGPADLVGRD